MKKGRIKTSDKYYKYSKNAFICCIAGMALTGLSFFVSIIVNARNFTNKHEALREETGYQDTIQDEMDYLDLQYKNYDINSDEYTLRRNKLLYEGFENYLKEQNNQYAIATLEEINNKHLFSNEKNIKTFIGVMAGSLVTIGATGFTASTILESKAKKMQKLEQAGFIEIDI